MTTLAIHGGVVVAEVTSVTSSGISMSPSSWAPGVRP